MRARVGQSSLSSSSPSTFRQQMAKNRLMCNIANDVVADCAKLEIVVDYNVALLAVNLFSLDPKYGINQHIAVADRKLTESLIRKCISLFSGMYEIYFHIFEQMV